MKPLSVHRLTSAVVLVTFTIALFVAAPGGATEEGVPRMSIQIYNNSTNYNIYPVLTTGTSDSSLWLQAWFKVPKVEMGNRPYPKHDNFRIYVNPEGNGIPPGDSVAIELPLLTQLVPTGKVDPKKPNQYIDWWGGGRIEIFDAPAANGEPPAALKALYAHRPTQTAVTPIRGATLPSCKGCQPLGIFKDTGGVFKNNAPSQLTEYTLGAINQAKDPVELVTYYGAVDIDVSYVDTVYLPVAMGVFDTRLPALAQVGYVGTPQPIDTFRKALRRFIAPESPYVGWPQFIGAGGKEKILKLASTMHAVAGDADLTPSPWKPIDRLTTLWNGCLGTDHTSICAKIKRVRAMFMANYHHYKAIYPARSSCDQSKKPEPYSEVLMIRHVYGFTPFGENCKDPKVNLLEKTPGYADHDSRKFHKVKRAFDDLQYWAGGKFNPYVGLIHDKGYIDAPNVYAYSVDDAVGNLQVDGSGFILVVGGTKGLANPTPAAPPIHVNFGGPSVNGSFTHYGICTLEPTTPVNPDFLSFGLSVAADQFDRCPISLKSDQGEIYSFKLKSDQPFPDGPKHLSPETHAPIDCVGAVPNSSRETWCKQIYAYSERPVGKGPDTRYVITPAL